MSKTVKILCSPLNLNNPVVEGRLLKIIGVTEYDLKQYLFIMIYLLDRLLCLK